MNPLNAVKFVPLSAMRAVALFVTPIVNNIPNTSIKRSIDINLQLATPELDHEAREQLSEQIIRNQLLSTVESVKSWAMPPAWSINQVNKVYNLQILEAALKDPKGMLAIVPHLGTWEIMNAWLNQFGSPTILYKPVKNRLQNDFILQGRQRLNSQMVPTDASGIKAIFKTLKSGGFSIILPDHVPQPSGGVQAPFFGIETLTSTLAPKLASKTKCSLVGLVCVRSDNDSPLKSGFDVHCFALDDPKLFDKDIVVATSALNKAMEDMIKRFPDHYMWSYRRFKQIPLINNPYKASTDQLKQFIGAYVKPKLLTQNAQQNEALEDSPDRTLERSLDK